MAPSLQSSGLGLLIAGILRYAASHQARLTDFILETSRFLGKGEMGWGRLSRVACVRMYFQYSNDLCLDSKMVSVENCEVRDGQGRRIEGHQKWQLDRVSSSELSVSPTISHPSHWRCFTQGPATPEFPVTSKMSLYSQFHKAINVYDDLEPSRGANYTLFTLIEGRRLHNTLN